MIENTAGDTAAAPTTPETNPQPQPDTPDVATPDVSQPSPDKAGQPGEAEPQKS